jgi:hypothetical protein
MDLNENKLVILLYSGLVLFLLVCVGFMWLLEEISWILF